MDFDLTLIIQLTIFITMLVSLNVLLFKPFMNVVKARHDRIYGLRAEADRLDRLSVDVDTAYKQRMDDARHTAQKSREKEINAGRDAERQLVMRARNDVSQGLKDARERIDAEAAKARNALSTETSVVAQRLVEKVLGHKVTP